MKTVDAVIQLSEELFLSLSSCGVTKERIANESRKLLALKYFQDKLLSLGKAAELAGLSKWDFIEYLSENHVPVIDYDDDELTREFETAKTVREHLA
jgi:predicted HTH domain antitoxin